MRDIKRIGVSNLQQTGYLARIVTKHDLFVTNHSLPVMVIISPDEYTRLKALDEASHLLTHTPERIKELLEIEQRFLKAQAIIQGK